MAIKLEWAQFSKFDSMNVYRSTSSIDTENLPTPLATGLTTMYYFDSTAVDGETYYYVVGMLLNGSEYLSEQVRRIAKANNDEYSDYVVYYASFNESIEPEINTSGAATTNVNGCSIINDDGALEGGYLSAGAGSYIHLPLDLSIGSEPFCIDFYANGSSTSGYAGWFSCDGVIGSDHANVTLASNWWLDTQGSGWQYQSMASGTIVNSWKHYAISWDGLTIRMFAAGSMQSSQIHTTAWIQKGKSLIIGKKSDYLSEANTNLFQHFRITKGVARYTENFTPPVINDY